MPLRRTQADYLAIAIGPILIGVLVASLVFFLIEVFYHGEFNTRLQFIMAMFVMGAVGVARISVDEGREYSIVYALPLAIVTAIAAWRFVEFHGPLSGLSPLISVGLIALIWWCTDRLIWDCTVIDEADAGSGEGLLQTAGLDSTGGEPAESNDGLSATDAADGTFNTERVPGIWSKFVEYRRRPHAPGVWVLYFSLAALPIFGIGQLFLPADDIVGRRFVFKLLVVYVSAGLGLLLITSFLGLRRYLRHRRIEMPAEMARRWVLLGTGLIVGILLFCVLLPRRNPEYSIGHLAFFAKSPDDLRSSQWAVGNDGLQQQQANRKVKTKEGKVERTGQTDDKDGVPEPGPPEQSQRGAQGKQQKSPKSDGQQPNRKQRGGKQNKGSQRDAKRNDSRQKDSEARQSNSRQPDSQESSDDQPESRQRDSQQRSADQPELPAESQEQSRQPPRDNSPNRDSPDSESRQDGGRKPDDGTDSEPNEPSPDEQRSDAESPSSAEAEQQTETEEDSDRADAADSTQQPTDRKERSQEASENRQGRQGARGQQTDQPQSQRRSTSGGARPTSTSPTQLFQRLTGSLGLLIKSIYWVVIVLVAVYLLWRYGAELRDAIRAVIKGWKAFWQRLFGRGREPAVLSAEPAAEGRLARPFSDYSDPFLTGQFESVSADELIKYSFEAFEAWGSEHGCARAPDQTVHEFATAIGRQQREFAKNAWRLAELVSWSAYAKDQVPRACISQLQELWRQMRTSG